MIYKDIVDHHLKNKSDLKPCKFYEANKQLVDKEFKIVVEKEKKVIKS